MAKKITAKFKDIVGLEGDVKTFLPPAIGYTSANITLGGAGYPINQFHQQFLAFVEGIDVKSAGKISLISGLWDAFNDPIMGMITDRTRSKRGRHRPYLLIGALPFAISYILRWCSFGISGAGNEGTTWLWYLLSSILYGTFYTVMAIPHTAMLPQVAPQYFQRTQYKIVEYAMNSVGQISSYALTALALSNFNIKTMLTALPDPSPSDRTKYMLIGIFLSVWFLWPPIFSYFKTSEPSSIGQPKESLSPKALLFEYRSIFSNRAFRQYFIITLFYSMSKSFYSITDQYFMISVADMYKYFISLNLISGIAEFSGSPINYLLVRYKGKTFCGKLLGPLMVSGLFLNIFITPKSSGSVKAVLIFLSAVLYNIGFSGPGFVGENIQPDVTDVDEMISGKRREGVVSTFNSLFKKTISSVMSYAVGASLDAFGYDAKKPKPEQQSASSTLGLRLNFIIIPSVLALFCVLSIYRYSMTKKDHELIKQLIAKRHEQGFVEVTEDEKKRLEKIAGQSYNKMWLSTRRLPETVTTTQEDK